MNLKAVIHLLRPEQWIKNFFVFIPLFFNGKLFDFQMLSSTLVAFLSFCFISSSIYCLNDIQDVERDRKHPVKCHRPIASGAISIGAAKFLMIACVVISLTISLTIINNAPLLTAIIVTYFILNLAYSFKLKQYAIIDVFIIAVGFVLRVFAGGTSSHIDVTPWLVMMTFLLALFLAFAKRRDDVVLYNNTGVLPRKGIDRL
jgi:decaprenyl-phosphate phosphoribosyltransferase